jgi:tetratricopeptide (TPR) repeat protein
MHTWTRTNWLGVVVGTAGLLMLWAVDLRADEPKAKGPDPGLPPWQRLLTGADARHANELQERIDALYDKGAFAEAVEPAEKLWRLRQRQQGADHWETADAQRQMQTLQAVAGKPSEQRRALAQAAVQSRQAQELYVRGRYREEEPLRQQLLTTLRQILGEGHPDTAGAYNNLALCQENQGRYSQAELNYERALAIARKALGEDHPHTGTAYSNLALCQHSQGRYGQAERSCERALAIARKALGEGHFQTATGYNNLALCQESQGRYGEAERGYERALAIHRKALGEDHPRTATAYHNLAGCRQAQGRYAQAEQGHERALAIRRQALGEGHPDTAQAYSGLAGCQRAQGRYGPAELGYGRALAIYEKALGEDHPDTAAAYSGLALCQQDQGRYGQAEQGLERALAIVRKALGEDHPQTATAWANLALCQYAQGRYAQAERGFERALAIRRRALGEGHPDTAAAYDNLAACQYSQGRYAQAEQGCERALAITQKALGEEHPDTAGAYINLAACQRVQGRDARAEELLARAADAFRAARLRVTGAGLGRAAFASANTPLPPLAAVLARNGKPEQAWERWEEGLGRGSGDELAARLRRTPAERQRQTELLARLDQTDRRLQALAGPKPAPDHEQQRKDLLTQQRQALDGLHALAQELERKYGVAEGQVLSLAQVQARLAADTALVGWVDLKREPKAVDPKKDHWGVVLRCQGPPAWVRLPGSGPQGAWTKDDDQLPGRLVKALARAPGAGAADWQARAKQLANQRLEPLAGHLAARDGLPAVRHVVVLPSDKMDGVPLGVLDSRYTTSRAPSASWYAHLRALARPKSEGLLAVADPVFKRPDAPPPPLPPGGILLTLVAPGSNAAKAGLKPGDVLLRYDQTRLNRRADLKPRPEADDPKASVEVEVWRDGKSFTRKLGPGKLGVLLADEPAPEALSKRRQQDRLLAARGPDGQGWRELPGTRAEAAALARLFAAAKQPVTLLADADASEPRLAGLGKSGELGRFRYLHLATHGTYDPRFPLQSGVILSQPARPEVAPPELGRYVFDGELTAAEVLENWQLDAELVTLSACETGLGKHERGEGFLGFAQAVLLAGGRSVCLSLWEVDDAATALLMERLYQNLLGQRPGLKGPLPKARALAEAQAWLRTLPRAEAVRQAARLTGGVARGKGRPARPLLPPVPEPAPGQAEQPPYVHPYYWAAFVLIGDPD